MQHQASGEALETLNYSPTGIEGVLKKRRSLTFWAWHVPSTAIKQISPPPLFQQHSKASED